MKRGLVTLGVLLGLSLHTQARAAEHDSRHVSLTLSPIHLIFPIVEAQVELLVVPHFSVAAIGGVGSIAAKSNDPVVDGQRFSVQEVGGQIVGYPLREFSSLQLGAEVLWVHVATKLLAGQEISGKASGVAFGPFAGYKLITSGGFTFFVQGGFEYESVTAHATDTTGTNAHDQKSGFIPLLNLNIGWSF
ncbi:MAG TPA: hypothetical protein VL137_11045 [Polyangiaceae bacterium]|nr:hypothetical protein [Polyangiaceae bacterium]